MAVFDHLGGRRLTGDGGATATELAEVAGTTPSAMSYHLRTLDKAGFLEEAPSRGDARERVWRLRLQSLEIGAEPDAPASERVAGEEMERAFAEQQNLSLMHYQSIKHTLTPELRDLGSVSQGHYHLTLAQAADLKARLMRLHEEATALTLENVTRNRQGDADQETVTINFVSRTFPIT
jgi:DNA-binding transcriptional ArsR family regulator